MSTDAQFELSDFTPYLLNAAAEAQSLRFSKVYKDRYGMLRTEWRVLFHLGRYGPMSAREISRRAGIHKTKVSRAVAALERKRFLERRESAGDRRVEILSLRAPGRAAFADLSRQRRRRMNGSSRRVSGRTRLPRFARRCAGWPAEGADFSSAVWETPGFPTVFPAGKPPLHMRSSSASISAPGRHRRRRALARDGNRGRRRREPQGRLRRRALSQRGGKAPVEGVARAHRVHRRTAASSPARV
jgi:DNA-binding MarR family transcriptional regulator